MEKGKSPRVLVFGTFDPLHPGHLFYLRQAKKYGTVTAVIARDKTIKKLKHHPPYFNERRRRHEVELSALAEKVVLGHIHDPYRVISEQHPDIILLGYDQRHFVEHLPEELKQRNIRAQILKSGPFHSPHFKSTKLRRALKNPGAGFLCVNKPSGPTSHDIIIQARKAWGIKKIGHAGTLDPLAQGLLIVGINQATSLLDWWHFFPKTYIAEIELGKTSDTYDAAGNIKSQNPNVKNIDVAKLKKTLQTFQGKQLQTPPPYSAKKIHGKKSYEFARKGEVAALKKQIVEISDIKLLQFNYPKAALEITCSTGTYIRALINDIGKKLRCGAIMTSLERTRIGPAALDASVTVEKINRNNLADHLYPPKRLLKKINQYALRHSNIFFCQKFPPS